MSPERACPLLIEKMLDIYDTLNRGYTIHAETVISKDGKDAIESIGDLLRRLDAMPKARRG